MGVRPWISLNSAVLICIIFTISVFLVFLPGPAWLMVFCFIIGSAGVYKIKKEQGLGAKATRDLEKLLRKQKKLEEKWESEQVRMNKSLTLEIQAHTEAENQLRESEEKYRNLVNSLPEGIFILQNQKIVFFNPGLEILTGLCPDDLYQLDPGSFFEGWQGNEQTTSDLSFIKGPDLSKIFIESQWVEIRFNGRCAKLYALRDITERLLANREKDRLESELERAKKMEALGLMAAGVAHDLNNILSGIVSTPDLLLMELAQDSDLRETVLIIKDSGKRASVIVDELLTLGREWAIAGESVRLNDVVNDYLGSPEFRKSCEYHPKVQLETVLDKALPSISGSGLHMRKVVMNLVSNAMEAIPGQGRITLTTGQICFKGTALSGYEKKLHGEHIRLTVADTGPGIHPDDLERIFEPFYTKKILGRSGTGLGLSIVWNVVHDHKGYIQVKSCEDGTCFDIYLPASSALRDEDKPDRIYTLNDYVGNDETILVVDDDKNQRKITSNMLGRMGYRVTAVESGEAAVDYLALHHVDLVVLDMIMAPGIDGLSTFVQLRAIDPRIRAVLASGYSKNREVEMAQESGAGAFIKKPFSLETLGLAVKKELKGNDHDSFDHKF